MFLCKLGNICHLLKSLILLAWTIKNEELAHLVSSFWIGENKVRKYYERGHFEDKTEGATKRWDVRE
jgi:hypothetical protein